MSDTLSRVGQDEPVVLPGVLSSGGFTFRNVGVCYEDAHIATIHSALSGLTDSDLSKWGC